MVTKELSKSAVEMNAIFENMSVDLLNKIPLNLRKFFYEIASKDYKFEYNKTKRLNEQKLMPRTKGIIAIIYRDFLCNKEEKDDYNKVYNGFWILNEKEKQEKYKNDIFMQNKKETDINLKKSLPIENKKISLLKKIFEKIKNVF